MMQQAADYMSGLCIDGTATNYKIVPCETLGSTCEQRMREAMALLDNILTREDETPIIRRNWRNWRNNRRNTVLDRIVIDGAKP